MADRPERSIVDVIINGEKAFSTVKELRAAMRQLVAEFNVTTDPARKEKLAQAYQKLNGQLKEQQDLLKGTSGLFSKLSADFQTLGIAGGLVAAISTVKSFFNESLQAYDLQVQAEQKLLNALGGRKDIQRSLITQAKELQKAVNIPDEVIIAQQAFLVAQGRSEQQIKKTIAAAIQLSAVTGISLDDSVRKLDGTMEGQIGRLGKLDKQFTELSKTQLENGAAIDLVLQKYKGFAETAAREGLGPQKQFLIILDDIAEKAGKLFAVAFLPIIKGLSSVASSINDLLSPTIDLTAEWEKQQSVTNNLEKNIAPLLDRYDELKSKTELSASEQDELKNIIQTVGEALPGAIKGFDEYGKAIDISTSAARNAIQAQRELTAFENRDAIKKITAQIDTYQSSIQGLVKTLNEGGYAATNMTTGISTFHQLSPDEIKQFQQQVADLNKEMELLGLQKKKLSGEPLVPEVDKKGIEGELKTITQYEDKLKALKTELDNAVIGSENYARIAKEISDIEIKLKIITPNGEKVIEDTKQLVAKINELKAATIKDDEQRELAAAEAKYKNEKAGIEKSTAAVSLKNEALVALEQKYGTEKSDISEKYQDKYLKAQEETDQKRLDLQQRFIEQSDKAAVKNAQGNAERLAAELKQTVDHTQLQLEQLELAADKEKEEKINGATKTAEEVAAIDAYYAGKKLEVLQQNAEATEVIIKKTDAELLQVEIDNNANRLEALKGNWNAEAAFKIKILKDQEAKELLEAQKNGQDKKAIHDKFAKLEKQVTLETEQAKLGFIADNLTQAAGLFKEHTAAYKLLATAAALINTYKAASLALATYPPPYGAIAAGVSIATGLGEVAKINAVQFATGTKLEGPSHNEGGIQMYRSDTGELVGEAAGGEYMYGPDFGQQNKKLMDYLLVRNQTGGGEVSVENLLHNVYTSTPVVNFNRLVETTKIEKYSQGTFIAPAPQYSGRGLANNTLSEATNDGGNTFANPPMAMYQQMMDVMNRTAAVLEDIQKNGIEATLGYQKFNRDKKRLDGVTGKKS